MLVVEDEPSILELLATALRFVGMHVQTATTGEEALAVANKCEVDLIVLDVMLPDIDGFEVTRRLRSAGGRVPVLFLTARDGTEDKVTGLTLGGDDYLSKPFSLEELIARMRAVLRRTSRHAHDHLLRVGDLELDEDSYQVSRAGETVELSPTEFKLLRYLLRNAGRVMSRAQILDHVWQYDFNGDSGIVESYVSHLRRKIDDREPRLLHTVRGVGYVVRQPPR